MTSHSAFIDLEETGQSEAEQQLQFHEFSSSVPAGVAQIDVTSASPSKEHTHTFTAFPDSALSDDDDGAETELLNRDLGEKATPSFWTLQYYQQFFNVDSKEVGQRILWSMVPRPGYSYLQHYIRPRPDLYGPFWICLTLVFMTAVAGNLANYLQVAASGTYHWKYDFHKVSFAAAAIFSYAWIVPVLLFLFLWWRGDKINQARLTFLEIICLYGYSLSIYIPISILWVIQISWLQWCLVLIGTALSGSVLLFALWAAVKDDQQKVAFSVMGIVLLLHLLLAMGFMLYFFHVPSIEVSEKTATQPAAHLPTKAPEVPLLKGPAPGGGPEKPEDSKPVEGGGVRKPEENKSLESPKKLETNKRNVGKIKSEDSAFKSKTEVPVGDKTGQKHVPVMQNLSKQEISKNLTKQTASNSDNM